MFAKGSKVITAEFIQSHRQATLFRPHQINLHDYCSGPTQSLINPQQHVRKSNPFRAGRKDD